MMTRDPTPDRQEAFHRLADVFGCKWTLAIIDAIRGGARRPAQIRRQLPDLSDKVLHERLAKLERYGLLRRRRFDDRVAHVEYEFTDAGRAMLPVIDAARALVDRWVQEVPPGRANRL